MPRPALLRRLLLPVPLAVGGIALALAPWPRALADGALNLRGVVPSDCTVGITDMNATLNITGGETSVLVGQIMESCNHRQGFTVSISSRNGGSLVGQNGTQVAYSIRYGTEQNWRTLSSQRRYNRNRPATGGQAKPLYVKLPATPTAPSGSYGDTIIITVAAR